MRDGTERAGWAVVVLAVALALVLAGILIAQQLVPGVALPKGGGSERRYATTITATTAGITQTLTTAKQDVGRYAEAAAFASVDVGAAEVITVSVQQSPEGGTWGTLYTFGSINTDTALTYTVLSNFGRYLRFTTVQSGTALITPTLWWVVKE